MTWVYKIADVSDWRSARDAGIYGGSVIDAADGYIHLSTGKQLSETARRHYRGRSDLIVARIDLARLEPAVRWEPSRGGDLFPHLYDVLPLATVDSERPARVSEEGQLIFVDGGPPWP